MTSSLKRRFHFLDRGKPLTGEYILYLPKNSQRVSYNFTLKKAIEEANALKKPLLIYYPLSLSSKNLTLRHFLFLLEGLWEFKSDLEKYGLNLVVRVEESEESLIKICERSALLVTDFPYLKEDRAFIEKIVKLTNKPVILVEGNVVVPVAFISQREEPYARTLRPKILKFWRDFFEDFYLPELETGLFPLEEKGLELEGLLYKESSLREFCQAHGVDLSVEPVRNYFKGGYSQAKEKLEVFIREKLPFYAEYRSEPGYEIESNLSPYLRYGQISPIEILKKILESFPWENENVQSFFNELVVWRELARNFCLYNPNFDSFLGLPEWARKTLLDHAGDERESIYSLEELERAEVADECWRAAQIELLKRGKIHNYVRMYWCKRLLFWTRSPEEAFRIALYLNNKYALDGEDPNTYLGVAWCFGAFDHPFQERRILGRVRSFTLQALKRKKSLAQYLKKWLNEN